MTAPESNFDPESPLPPEALATGQRTLAAIVFTDTVGFSGLMSRNEELTLRLVARDLAYMKTTCAAFGGQVLKSTGDGLLMLFTSAVQAVACALEIQRDFQKQNLEHPKGEQLQHRIGIHLGDIFQSGGDVMGDGVNIAARLQTEAVPGGICLSKTVYDVVNNRLQFYVNDLGARKLKNIGTVTAYQISPMGKGTGWQRISWYRMRMLITKAAIAILVVLFAVGIFWIGAHREWAASHPGDPRAFTLIPVRSPAPAVKSVPKPEPIASVASPEPAASAPAAMIKVTNREFEMARFERMRNYDFQGMMDWIAGHDWPEKSSNHLSQRCHDLQHLFRWTQERLHAYSETSPLVITEADGKKTEFWTVSFGGLRMKTGSQTITVMREQIPPAMMQQIVSELLKEQTVSPVERAHFQLDLAVFNEAYRLPVPGAVPGNP